MVCALIQANERTQITALVLAEPICAPGLSIKTPKAGSVISLIIAVVYGGWHLLSRKPGKPVWALWG